jgi:hypothetical protein
LPGYSIYRQDRVETKGGGVCIFLLDEIFSDFFVDTLNISITSVDSLFLHIFNKEFSVLLGCIYRPPKTKSEIDTELFSNLSQLFSQHKNLVITGDFNFPDMIWPFNSQNHIPGSCNTLVEFLCDTHVAQIIDQPTRFRLGQTPHVLDLIFVSEPSLISNVDYSSPIGKSDHSVVTFEIQASISKRNKKALITKSLVNFEQLNADLLCVDWKNELADESIEIIWKKFLQILTTLREKNSTIKTFISNPKKPWIKYCHFQSIKHKKNLWRKYRQSGLEIDFANHRKFSNSLSKEIRRARANYEQSICESNNSKRFYKYIRSNLNSKVSIPSLRLQNKKLTTSNVETANLFACQFYDAFSHNTGQLMPQFDTVINHSLTSVDFTEEIICDKLSKLKSSSPGLDKISSQILKNCQTTLAYPLSLIMQKSFETSRLPQDWKIAVVAPIYKKGDKFDSNNYRPISLTSLVVKVMESVIVDQINCFSVEQNILSDKQHGFTKGRSVETNLLHCLKDWSSLLDEGKAVDVVYLDFSKAFDKVPTDLLLQKLDACGIRGLLHGWVADFLKGRKFRVRVGDGLSDMFDVISGVPQGSVLGPKLFLLYTAELPKLVSSSCVQYADDTKLYVNPLISHSALQNDLNLLSNWCQSWALPLNISKCEVLHMGKNNQNLSYYIDGSKLPAVNSHVDLGVLVTNDLSWSDHILKTVKKANKILFLIKRTFCRSSYITMSKLFKLYVRPILEFANTVWHPVLVRDQKLLENVQRKFTRHCFRHCERTNYMRRMSEMKLIPLIARKRRGDLIFSFKILKGIAENSNLLSLYHLRNNSRLRGHPLTLQVRPFKTHVRKFFLPSRVTEDWNSLTTDIVDLANVNQFKRKIDDIFDWLE